MAQPSHSSCLLGPNSLGNCLSFFSTVQCTVAVPWLCPKKNVGRVEWCRQAALRSISWHCPSWSGSRGVSFVPDGLPMVSATLLQVRVEWFSTIFRISKTTQGCRSCIYLGAQFQKIGNFDHTCARLTRSKVPFPKNHKDLINVYIFFKFAKTFHILQRTIAKNIIWN